MGKDEVATPGRVTLDKDELMEMWLAAILFLTSASAACGVMLVRRMVYAGLLLVIVFVGWAGFFWLLEAPFIGLVQLLVYVGAVVVLILFAMMLTREREADEGEGMGAGALDGRAAAAVGGGAMVILFGVLASSLLEESWAMEWSAMTVPIWVIGESLVGRYAIALIGMALLLTVAVVGAVLLARPPEERAGAAGEREDR